MKKIEAIIKEEQLDKIKDALTAAGFVGMTIIPVKGRGETGGIELQWRAGKYTVDFLHKLLLMLVVSNERYEEAVQVIIAACQSDHMTHGAGRIFVSSIDEVIQIRTGTRQADDENKVLEPSA